MSTVTIDSVHEESRPSRGLFTRALERIDEVQMHRARAIAKPYLLELSDEELHETGYTREEVSRWPSGGRWL